MKQTVDDNNLSSNEVNVPIHPAIEPSSDLQSSLSNLEGVEENSPPISSPENLSDQTAVITEAFLIDALEKVLDLAATKYSAHTLGLKIGKKNPEGPSRGEYGMWGGFFTRLRHTEDGIKYAESFTREFKKKTIDEKIKALDNLFADRKLNRHSFTSYVADALSNFAQSQNQPGVVLKPIKGKENTFENYTRNSLKKLINQLENIKTQASVEPPRVSTT